MWTEKSICATCGEALNPMAQSCSHCNLEIRKSKLSNSDDSISATNNQSEPLIKTAPPKQSPQDSVAAKPPESLRLPLLVPPSRKPIATQTISITSQQGLVYLLPEENKSRFPAFTEAKLKVMAAGAGLLIFSLLITWLLWWQRRDEQARLEKSRMQDQAVLYSATTTATPDFSLVPASPATDDKAITKTIRLALGVYNPVAAATRYQFSVQDGVVTLDGYVLNQAEKNGAENVIRKIAGVKMLCSSLFLAPEPKLEPVMVKLNEAEAKRLDEALFKQIAEEQKKSDTSAAAQPEQVAVTAPAIPDPQREAERLRREQEQIRLREEEAALRRQEEERLRQEAAEAERRRAELQRAESERQTRFRQSTQEAGALRSGTVAWSGLVEGMDEIIISGSSVSVRHLGGDPVREARASFSAPVPRSTVNVRLLSSNGRGSITIVQEPSAANGYTTIVRADDSSKGGSNRYEFTLRWSVQ